MTSKKNCSKVCPPEKVCNPDSGRCVSRTGTIGRRVLLHASEQHASPNPCRSGCPPDKVCNPDSGRCVSRTGTIGRRLLRGVANGRAAPAAPAPAASASSVAPPPAYGVINAVMWGNMGLLKSLIDAGADVNARDGDGYTALQHAVHEGRQDMVAYLLMKGANPNAAATYDGEPMIMESPLMEAISMDDAFIVNQLLRHGANPNQWDVNEERTVLAWSIIFRAKPEIIRALIQAGADPTRGNPGETALDLARGSNYLSMLERRR